MLMSILGGAPSFKDEYFTERTIETEFQVLHEGLSNVRRNIGEERYFQAMEIAAQMRALFEADPEDKTGQTHEGCLLVWEIDKILENASKG